MHMDTQKESTYHRGVIAHEALDEITKGVLVADALGQADSTFAYTIDVYSLGGLSLDRGIEDVLGQDTHAPLTNHRDYEGEGDNSKSQGHTEQILRKHKHQCTGERCTDKESTRHSHQVDKAGVANNTRICMEKAHTNQEKGLDCYPEQQLRPEVTDDACAT